MSILGFLHTSPIAIMPEWCLYFTTYFKSGSLILLATGSYVRKEYPKLKQYRSHLQ